jgi:hypothetical protein
LASNELPLTLSHPVPITAKGKAKKNEQALYYTAKDKVMQHNRSSMTNLDSQIRNFKYWALSGTTAMLTMRHYDAAGSSSWNRLLTGRTLWLIYQFARNEGLQKIAAVVLVPGAMM